MAENLTTLANVKTWLSDSLTPLTTTDDALLTSLINQASRAIYAYLSVNTLFLQTLVDAYDGVNNVRQVLAVWPVISVASVYINGSNILPAPALPQTGFGWRLQTFNGVPPGRPQALDVYGIKFWRGRQNIVVTYNSGYSVTEAKTIPSTPYQLTANQTYGTWGQDDGVVSTTGRVFTAVASMPATGQYSVNGTTGVYTFNSADAGTQLLISYSYVPSDIEGACIAWVGSRYRFKERIDFKSKSLGGQETASYDISAMPAYVALALQPYKRTNVDI